jgi:hypothetical protein
MQAMKDLTIEAEIKLSRAALQAIFHQGLKKHQPNIAKTAQKQQTTFHAHKNKGTTQSQRSQTATATRHNNSHTKAINHLGLEQWPAETGKPMHAQTTCYSIRDRGIPSAQ